MFWLRLQKFQRAVLTASARLIEGIIVVAIVLVGGLGSSWYMVEAGSRLTTLKQGPWVTWTAAARPDADPYTRAHFASTGTLPISSEVQHTHMARVDSGGERLHSSCDYAIEGLTTKADWWSIAVFDERGRLIPNAADRQAYTIDTIAASGTASPTVLLSREARAGNWLPTGRAGRLAVMLNIVDARAPPGQGAKHETTLPTIRKLKCR
jgi:hypothetical protein